MRNSPNSRIYLETLEEIASSDELINAFADETEQYYFVPAPKNFAESVINSSHSLDVQVAVKTGHASKKLQFFIYSLQVGTAVAGAIFLLFALPRASITSQSSQHYDSQRVESRFSQHSRQLSHSMMNFSYEFFNWR